MNVKKYLSFFVISISMLIATPVMAAEEQAAGGGIIDDSIRDITIVLGAGAVGAVLGLSTLSFVERPSDHMKNIAIGGAIGVVFGVGAVIFNQANRTSAQELGASAEMSPAKFNSLSRLEFKEHRVLAATLKRPDFLVHFSF